MNYSKSIQQKRKTLMFPPLLQCQYSEFAQKYNQCRVYVGFKQSYTSAFILQHFHLLQAYRLVFFPLSLSSTTIFKHLRIVFNQTFLNLLMRNQCFQFYVFASMLHPFDKNKPSWRSCSSLFLHLMSFQPDGLTTYFNSFHTEWKRFHFNV